jgi:hydroxymethylpyrimidine/phosphomethylpyrimidine kinase
VKIGMLGTTAITRAVADGLAAPLASGTPAHVVVDPVMVAKSGDALLSNDAISMLIEAIFPLATVLTPNLPEAGVLLQRRAPADLSEMRRAAEDLRRLLPASGSRWVLVKGGHLSGPPTDVLFDGSDMLELPSERIDTRNTHGTGCTLSAAIAALLPQRTGVAQAITEAKHYVTQAIAHADRLHVGHGPDSHGPVHHFFASWK